MLNRSIELRVISYKIIIYQQHIPFSQTLVTNILRWFYHNMKKIVSKNALELFDL